MEQCEICHSGMDYGLDQRVLIASLKCKGIGKVKKEFHVCTKCAKAAISNFTMENVLRYES
jgi:hypothetical protein